MIFLKDIFRYVCMFNYVWRSAMYVLQSQDWMLCTHTTWLLSSAGTKKIFDGHNNGHWTFFPTQRALPKEIFTCDMSNVIQHEIFPYLPRYNPKVDIAQLSAFSNCTQVCVWLMNNLKYSKKIVLFCYFSNEHKQHDP